MTDNNPLGKCATSVPNIARIVHMYSIQNYTDNSAFSCPPSGGHPDDYQFVGSPLIFGEITYIPVRLAFHKYLFQFNDNLMKNRLTHYSISGADFPSLSFSEAADRFFLNAECLKCRVLCRNSTKINHNRIASFPDFRAIQVS